MGEEGYLNSKWTPSSSFWEETERKYEDGTFQTLKAPTKLVFTYLNSSTRGYSSRMLAIIISVQ